MHGGDKLSEKVWRVICIECTNVLCILDIGSVDKKTQAECGCWAEWWFLFTSITEQRPRCKELWHTEMVQCDTVLGLPLCFSATLPQGCHLCCDTFKQKPFAMMPWTVFPNRKCGNSGFILKDHTGHIQKTELLYESAVRNIWLDTI